MKRYQVLILIGLPSLKSVYTRQKNLKHVQANQNPKKKIFFKESEPNSILCSLHKVIKWILFFSERLEEFVTGIGSVTPTVMKYLNFIILLLPHFTIIGQKSCIVPV